MRGFQTKLGELFPTKWSLFIFFAYMALFVNQGILVKSSQSNDNTYSYNVVTLILCTELLKLIICTCIYLKDKSICQFISDIKDGSRIGLLYLIPALLYCLYNNLAFVNLANYDPTTYFILLQFRNVITGIFYQTLFKKKLSKLQWFSLVILTFGCIVKELGQTEQQKDTNDIPTRSFFTFNLLLILIQIFCSCFAGVYNEYLLKDIGSSVNILIQNVYMYFDSILSNLLLLFITSPNSVMKTFDFVSLLQPVLLLILVNGALAGITTSFFLKSLNSIVKTFAATIEIVLTAILCYFIFGTPVDIYTIISIILIFFAIFIYSQKPVTNQNTSSEHCDSDKSQTLQLLITK